MASISTNFERIKYGGNSQLGTRIRWFLDMGRFIYRWENSGKFTLITLARVE
jgi:hypothetical protein